MTESTENPVLTDSAALLVGYGFDLDMFEVDELIAYWSSHYPLHWLRAAILEALHQGRYKAISVGQILVIWRRRGQPLPHYSYEFERAVCGRFLHQVGSGSSSATTSTSTAPDSLDEQSPATNPSFASANPNTLADSSSLLASQTLDQSGGGENTISLESLDRADESVDVAVDIDGEPSKITEESSTETSDVTTPALAADVEAIAPPSDPHALSLDSDDECSEHAGLLVWSGSHSNDASSSPPEPTLPQVDMDSEATIVTDVTSFDTTQSINSFPEEGKAADLSTHTEAPELWGRASITHLPIHHYVPVIPRSETSTFYAKLRAVAYSDEMP